MNLLVILPHNPGDVVMGLQAVRRIKAEFPGLLVDYLVSEECRELVGGPLIRRAWVLPKRAMAECWDLDDGTGAVERMEAFLQELGAERYDVSANLFQERFGGLIQGFVQADRKIGLELHEGRGFRIAGSRYLEHLAAVPADRGGNGWHAVDIYIRALRRALDPSASRNARVTSRAEAAAAVLPALIRPDAAKSLQPGAYLAFHPGAAWPGKRWPEAHWSALANACAAAGFTLAFTGAPEERALMDRIRSGLDGSAQAALVDCVGATSLLGAAWIIAHARMLITGDTVAMHLAAAAGAPTLSLFGASNPVETGPYGRGHVVIQTDANPLPDLEFDREHAGLAHLRPEEAAGYILDGVPPPGFALYETGRDESLDMQVLRDYQKSPHPFHRRAEKLMRALDASPEGPLPSGLRPMPRPDGPRGVLHRLLEEGARRMDPEGLRAIEAAERVLAEEASASLIWEAYRIAVNGMSLADARAHLAERLGRFERALREEDSAT